MSGLRVAVVAGTSIGGTEKGATILAGGLAERGYAVDYISHEGPRSAYLRERGVRCRETPPTAEQFCAYLEDARPAVVHQHVAGYPTDNIVYPAFRRLETANRPRPKLIETNVFGRLQDPDSHRFADFRMFISAASAAQAFRRASLTVSEELLHRQTVLYYPVVPPKVSRFTISADERAKVRRHFGVSDTDVLAVRVGQPGHKWNSSEATAFRLATKWRPELSLRLLMMEPPQPLRSKIAAGRFGEGIIVREATSDFEWLEQVYAASDLMIHASDWGESFGYTLAEGMAAGLPVVTRSTPWGDNAQVELVQNGATGFVCGSTPEMARRFVDLATDAALRNSFGAAGRERILQLTNPASELDVLEEIIAFVMGGTTGAKLDERRKRLLAFVDDFPRREQDLSEPFSRHPQDRIAGNLHRLYRTARSRARALVNRVRTRQTSWNAGGLQAKQQASLVNAQRTVRSKHFC